MTTYLDAYDPVEGVTVQPSLEAALGIDLSGTSADRVPTGGAIIVHNRRSPLDPFVIALAIARATDLEPVVIVQSPIEDNPLVSSLLEAGSLQTDVAVTRGAVDLTRSSDLIKHMLDSGRPVLLASGRSGAAAALLGDDAALLAEAGRLGALVVPAATYGAHRRYDGTSLRSTPGRVATTVAFGPPVAMDRRIDDATATAMLHADIEHLLAIALGAAPDSSTIVDGTAAGPDADATETPWAGDVWAGVRADSDVLVDPDRMPELPDLEAAEQLLPKSPPRRPAATTGRADRVEHESDDEVAGVLSFHFPGKPMQSVRRATIEHPEEGRLSITTRRATALLADVAVRTQDDRTIYVGELVDEYPIQSGGVRMTIPARTRVAFLQVRSHDGDLDPAAVD